MEAKNEFIMPEDACKTLFLLEGCMREIKLGMLTSV
jgi:hypothetical protein